MGKEAAADGSERGGVCQFASAWRVVQANRRSNRAVRHVPGASASRQRACCSTFQTRNRLIEG